MFSEEDLLPLSALQHVVFCPRRAALIHMEGLWQDNLFTAQGSLLHKRVHAHTGEARGGVRLARGLFVRSFSLGVFGKADIVEFHQIGATVSPPDSEARRPQGLALTGMSGLWRPFPVEFKRGRRRHEESFEVQLCAQAICLEEMLQVEVPVGAIFFGKTRHRLEITFEQDLRSQTQEAASLLHQIIRSRRIPKANYAKKCKSCSLFPVCMPKASQAGSNVEQYLRREVSHLTEYEP